ncbi:MAG: uroporphyrinogen-III synthase [Lactobacillus sp.]|jgi:uroporphyrinogen-III synthase|nr:uroporphyrinogen-III synthase [Lactobacillus sp.]
MAKKYLITRSQKSLPTRLLTRLLQQQTDFINLTELVPLHLQRKQIQLIKNADILALTSGFALQCIQPFFQNAAKKPQLAVISTRLQLLAQKAGFDSVLTSRSEQQDSLATMLRARMYTHKQILWLRGDLSDRYNPLNLNAKNWRALVVYKNSVTYLQALRLAHLLQVHDYDKILVTSNSAFERIIDIDPKLSADFVSMSYKSAHLIQGKGFNAIAPKQGQQRLEAAVKLLLNG